MELPRGCRTVNSVLSETKYQREERDRSESRPKPQELPLAYNPSIKMHDLEKFWILSAVQKCNGSISHAAKILGLARETVYRKVRIWSK